MGKFESIQTTLELRSEFSVSVLLYFTQSLQTTMEALLQFLTLGVKVFQRQPMLLSYRYYGSGGT